MNIMMIKSPLKYVKILIRIWIIICLLGLIKSLYPAGVNDGTISGFVFDKADGEVLIGVNVYLDETLLGGGTNLSGYYVIPEVPPGSYKLICSHIVDTCAITAGINGPRYEGPIEYRCCAFPAPLSPTKPTIRLLPHPSAEFRMQTACL